MIISYNNIDINTDFKQFHNEKKEFLQDTIKATELIDFCRIETTNELKF